MNWYVSEILMRSVETDSFIPLETILDMNIYVFNRMSKIVSDKGHMMLLLNSLHLVISRWILRVLFIGKKELNPIHSLT